MTVLKYIFGSSLLRNASYFLTIATGLIVTPILVRALGSEDYAKWVLINTLLIYFMAFDFGYSSSVARYVSRKYEEWGEGSAQRCITTAFYALCGALVVSLSLIAVGYTFLRERFFSGMPPELIVSVLFLLLCYSTIIPLRVFHGVLRSQLKWNTISLIVMTKSVLMNAIIVVMALNDYGLYAVIFPNAAFVIIEYLAYYFYAKRSYKFTLNPKGFDLRVLKSLSSYSISFFLIQVSNMFGRRMQAFFIALYISLPAVTIYTIGLQMLKYYEELMCSTFDVLAPYFSRHEQDSQRMISDYLTISAHCFSVAAFGGYMVWAYAKPFLYYWIGPELLPSTAVISALVIPFVLRTAHIPSRELLYGTSNHKFMVPLNVLAFAVNLTLLFFLVKPFGMAGVLWAMGSTMLFFRVGVFMFLLFRKMHIPAGKYLYNVYAKPLAVYMLPQFLIHYFIYPRFDVFSLELGFVFVLSIVLFSVTFYAVVRKELREPEVPAEQG
ncbi:lipopolysaccharide biosynthesis protein [Desulfovibrio sp. Fe33]|uniref:lipopolysaccharide biosynthesis protein n=1 Tax=Desulfovibrio sp. Fe33 TaxID=3020842 RepID=UPI00234D701A|nr:oligosaccharide flippase family protein [Desulfovibrio sp. Fe33]